MDAASTSVKLTSQQAVSLLATLSNADQSISQQVKFVVDDDAGLCGIFRVSDGKQLWGGRILANGSSATITSALFDPDATADSWVEFKQTDDGSEIHIVAPNYSGITPRVTGDEPDPNGVTTALIIRAHPVPAWDATASAYVNNIVAQVYCPGNLQLMSAEKVSLSGTSVDIAGAVHTAEIGSDAKWIDKLAAHFFPAADNTYDMGSTSFRVRKYYGASSTISTSDEREKHDLQPIDPDQALGFLMALAPIWFRLNALPEELRCGFGARQFRDAMRAAGIPEDFAGFDGADPDHLGLCYEQLIGMMVSVIRAQSETITDLKRRVSDAGL